MHKYELEEADTDFVRFGSRVIVYGLRSYQMAASGLCSFEQQVEATSSSCNGEKGWAIAYDRGNCEWFVGFPGRRTTVCRLNCGNLASGDAIHMTLPPDIMSAQGQEDRHEKERNTRNSNRATQSLTTPEAEPERQQTAQPDQHGQPRSKQEAHEDQPDHEMTLPPHIAGKAATVITEPGRGPPERPARQRDHGDADKGRDSAGRFATRVSDRLSRSVCD